MAPPLLAILLTAAPVDPTVAGFWGAENLKRLTAPAKVELFRVRAHDGYEERAPLAGVIGGYGISEKRGLVPVASAAPLVARLLERPTYGGFNAAKLCGGFHPGLAVRFSDASGSTDVMLCFTCDDIGWVQTSPVDAGTLGRSDLDPSPWSLAIADVGPGRLELLEAALALFPDDDLRRLRAEEVEHRAASDEFWSSFSPDAGAIVREAKALMERPGAFDERGFRKLVPRLAKVTTLSSCLHALGAHAEDWDPNSLDEVVVRVAETASSAQFEEAFEELVNDPVAVCGAARFFFSRFMTKVAEPRRSALAVELSRRTLSELTPASRVRVVSKLVALQDDAITHELHRIISEKSSWESVDRSAGGLAYMDLARRGRCPPGPAPPGDFVEVEVAKAICGDPLALTARAFEPSPYVFSYALGVVRAAPTRRHVELLVEHALESGAPWAAPAFELLRALAPAAHAPAPPKANDAAAAKRWWQAQRARWKE